MEDIRSLINQQNYLLHELIGLLKAQQQGGSQQQLGFGASPRPRYIYANRTKSSGLWYFLSDEADRKPIPIEHKALTCYIEKLEFNQVQRRDKDTWKLHLHVRADMSYIIEASHDSVFSKSLLAALAVIPPQVLKHPVTIEVKGSEKEVEALFCQVYADGEFYSSPWDRETDFKPISRQAIANIDAANNRNPQSEANGNGRNALASVGGDR